MCACMCMWCDAAIHFFAFIPIQSTSRAASSSLASSNRRCFQAISACNWRRLYQCVAVALDVQATALQSLSHFLHCTDLQYIYIGNRPIVGLLSLQDGCQAVRLRNFWQRDGKLCFVLFPLQFCLLRECDTAYRRVS